MDTPRTIEQDKELAERAARMNIILLGPPGSGKSTFVNNLDSLSQNITYISTGEVTRRRIAEGGEAAEQINQLYSTGKPWPDVFVSSLILPELLQAKSRGFILDGLPRKKSEVELLAVLLDDNEINLDMVVNIFTDYDTSLSRVVERMETEGSRPESLDHYKVRLDMYWNAIELFKRVLGEISGFVDIDSSNSSPKEIVTIFLNKIESI